MIKYFDDSGERDAWLGCDKYTINIQELGHDGSIRVEVILGDHLGKSVGCLMINAPRDDVATEPEPEPVIPWHTRAVKELEATGLKKKMIALMVPCHVRSIENWAKGLPITGPNKDRLLHVVQQMGVEVEDEG